jgi:hypothetical protein
MSGIGPKANVEEHALLGFDPGRRSWRSPQNRFLIAAASASRCAGSDRLAKRAETEKDGPIVANVANQLLMPTAFSSVK